MCLSWSIAYSDPIRFRGVCALVMYVFQTRRSELPLYALGRVMFELGMGALFGPKARLYILRRRFGVKERFLRLYARVPANAVGLPRSVCVIGVAYAPVIIISPISRACEASSGKAERQRFDWLIGCGRQIKERIRLGKT